MTTDAMYWMGFADGANGCACWAPECKSQEGGDAYVQGHVDGTVAAEECRKDNAVSCGTAEQA